ncbi:endonuclease domain-containing 1 protein-like [Ambystoma mexicanum]|uniref:endonuclease domain-containing 1 protein-like n=1 Tax=Ambystoma mexicanum TaxID=8296 RepID=UPI0037E7F6EA
MLLSPWFLVTLGCFTPGHAEVFLDTFTNTGCAKFFFKGTEPSSGLVPKSAAWICQRYGNQYHFATLYDRKNRIPVYSAYIYQPGPGSRADWLIEPQLVDISYNKSMDIEFSTKIDRNKLEESQAVSSDYKQSSQTYDRGHLNPSLHHSIQNSKTATFTLTNIVPQHNKLNQGSWNLYEDKMMKNKTAGCDQTFVLVGAVSGGQFISNGRVNVPSHIWTAACCLQSGGLKAWAAIAENSEKNEVMVTSVGEVEEQISKLINRNEQLLHEDCPRLSDSPPFILKEKDGGPNNKTPPTRVVINFIPLFVSTAVLSLQSLDDTA